MTAKCVTKSERTELCQCKIFTPFLIFTYVVDWLKEIISKFSAAQQLRFWLRATCTNSKIGVYCTWVVSFQKIPKQHFSLFALWVAKLGFNRKRKIATYPWKVSLLRVKTLRWKCQIFHISLSLVKSKRMWDFLLLRIFGLEVWNISCLCVSPGVPLSFSFLKANIKDVALSCKV